MPYVCLECEQTENFTGYNQITQWGVEEVFIGNDGEIYDYGVTDINDSQTDDGPNDITCDDCNSSIINWWDDDEERIELIRGHNRIKKEKRKKMSWKEIIETKE